MRKASKLVVLAAMACAFALFLPSAIAADVAGEVGGGVTITSPATGIPLQGCANTTYKFNDVILNGTLRDNGSRVFVGSIDTGTGGTEVKGFSTVCESTALGGGVVNQKYNEFGQLVADPASFSGTGVGTGGLATINGSFWGTYTRTESVVLVSLQVTFSINGQNAQTVTVNVRAQFTPTSFDTTTGGVKGANFAGEFSTV